MRSDLDSIAPGRRARTEAGAWLARLRNEQRTPADEQGFQAWLAADPQHRDAFEAVTAAFEAVGAVATRADIESPRRPLLARRQVLAGGAFAAAGVAGLAVFGLQRGLVRTEIGQQKRLSLADGSELVLDTGSSVRVALTQERRLVRLLAGRARFEVAKDAARPFIVRAGDRDVIAVGTAFSVSRLSEETAIFLEEGRVIVRDRDRAASGAVERPMAPGQRLVFGAAAVAPVEDRPDPAQATAWESGRAVFENETLATAAAEMNRYSRRRIEIADPEAGNLRISGVFRTADPASFAQSVALLLPVDVDASGDRLILRSRPGSLGS